ncbi:metabolite traffic protein EboE [Confluentibacter flavum]|uniref:Xylose isomerase n=1 Tax=Confluentibacter flavum TaxID=1909700 RepID=A0A2N3HI31_9FLAO|nr:metabolite traffic protein EboE [Confluentibacter flavum]PKQ44616.1 xylose isomerase [Confluentibacter flavum]
MLIKDTYHITYCSNIHPGEDWETTFSNIKKYITKIKKEVSGSSPFGIGLRLSNNASEELAVGDNLSDFKKWLSDNDCYVFTMNGFPYGNFHNTIVKEQVHAPDWTTNERLVYTKRLFTQLDLMLPNGISGGISTSPISYKHWFSSKNDISKALKKGAEQLCEIVEQLYAIEKTSGNYLHLDIEPEPDGLIENTKEFLDFYLNFLLPIGVSILRPKLNLDALEIENIIKRYITLCYDICHFSLAYENPEDTFQALEKEGIGVGKIQVSAALKILFEKGKEGAIWNSLERFDEPTYLHQVTEKVGGNIKVYNDLPIILRKKEQHKELRAHFHVPIFLEKFDNLYSTQDQILNTLQYLKNHQVSNHLEVETYTWDVLPNTLKVDITQSIARELNWLKAKLE